MSAPALSQKLIAMLIETAASGDKKAAPIAAAVLSELLGAAPAAEEPKPADPPADAPPPPAARVEKPALVTPAAKATFTVTNMRIPNQHLLLCRDAAGNGAKVWIHPEWRPLFTVGMVIEATQGSSGDWRSRKPRSMGRF